MDACSSQLGARTVTTGVMQAASFKLRIQQFSRTDLRGSSGRTRHLTRKEVLGPPRPSAGPSQRRARTQTLEWQPRIDVLACAQLLDEVVATSATHVLPSPHRQASKMNVLRPRDVRKVDPAFATRLEPAILVRAGCIILSLGKILSLVTRESLYCVISDGQEGVVDAINFNLNTLLAATEADAGAQAELAAEPLSRAGSMPRSHSDPSLVQASSYGPIAPVTPVRGSAPGMGGGVGYSMPPSFSSSPFEFAALEAVLMTASAELSRRQGTLSETLQRALTALRKNVVGTQVRAAATRRARRGGVPSPRPRCMLVSTSTLALRLGHRTACAPAAFGASQVVAGSRQLDHVRQLKQSVRELFVQSQALEEALREVLDEDEDMEAMYLTRRHLAVLEPFVEREHEEVELLLESYLQEVGATVAELEVLTYGIEGTEKFVSFRLDSARNRLLKVDVIATASATALGVGQVATGIFGMNLPTTLFDPVTAGANATFLGVAGGTLLVVILLIVALLLVFYRCARVRLRGLAWACVRPRGWIRGGWGVARSPVSTLGPRQTSHAHPPPCLRAEPTLLPACAPRAPLPPPSPSPASPLLSLLPLLVTRPLRHPPPPVVAPQCSPLSGWLPFCCGGNDELEELRMPANLRGATATPFDPTTGQRTGTAPTVACANGGSRDSSCHGGGTNWTRVEAPPVGAQNAYGNGYRRPSLAAERYSSGFSMAPAASASSEAPMERAV